jgi:hypothetical protein
MEHSGRVALEELVLASFASSPAGIPADSI